MTIWQGSLMEQKKIYQIVGTVLFIVVLFLGGYFLMAELSDDEDRVVKAVAEDDYELLFYKKIGVLVDGVVMNEVVIGRTSDGVHIESRDEVLVVREASLP